MPGDYRIDTTSLTAQSRRWLKRQGEAIRSEVEEAFARIAAQPRGPRPAYRHLKGPDLCLWGFRLHAVRIIYDIDAGRRVLGVLRIRPRSDVYDQR